jgi:hypothetical protein
MKIFLTIILLVQLSIAQENFMTQSGLAKKEDFVHTKSEPKDDGITAKDVLLSPVYAIFGIGYVAKKTVEVAVMGTMIGVAKTAEAIKDGVSSSKEDEANNK